MGSAGGGNITKLADDKWRIEIPLGRDAAGKRKRWTHVHHGTKKGAQKVLDAKILLRDTGQSLDGQEESSETLNELLDRWLETVVAVRTNRRSTVETYATVLRAYVRPDLGGKPISTVTTLMLQKVYKAMTDRRLSAKTVRYVNTVLGSAMKQAIKWKLITENPCEDVVLPKVPRKERKRLGEPAAANRVLDALRTAEHGPMLVVALLSGMRPSEYQALKPEDVDWSTGVITVQRSIEWFRDRTWAWADNKNSSSQRRIAMPPVALELMKEQRERVKAMRARAKGAWKEYGLLFPGPDGGPVKPRPLTTHLRRALAAAGLPPMTLYQCRHWSASLLLKAGKSAKAISDRLGHSSIKITMDVYSHILESMEQDVADTLQEMFGGSGEATSTTPD